MARNIDRVRPLEFLAVQNRAFQAGVGLRQSYAGVSFRSTRHSDLYVREALHQREALLPVLLRAEQVRDVITDDRFRHLTTEKVYDMVGSTLSMLGAKVKDDRDRLEAMVEVAESLPFYFGVTPFVLNMTREHFRDNWKWNFLPQPADFRVR